MWGIVGVLATLAVAVVSWLAAYFVKRGQVQRATWEIPAEVRIFDINMKYGFNKATGLPDEEPVTLHRILAAADDDQVMDQLRRQWVGIFRTVNDLKERHDKYRWWGRILRFGFKPKPLSTPEQTQDSPDLNALEARVLELEGQIGRVIGQGAPGPSAPEARASLNSKGRLGA